MTSSVIIFIKSDVAILSLFALLVVVSQVACLADSSGVEHAVSVLTGPGSLRAAVAVVAVKAHAFAEEPLVLVRASVGKLDGLRPCLLPLLLVVLPFFAYVVARSLAYELCIEDIGLRQTMFG